MSNYNYDDFSTSNYDFSNSDGPDLGTKAFNFTLDTTDGKKQELLNFSGDFLVLEMGSITCPLFQSRRTIMETLEDSFDNVSCAVLYVREAHPGEHIAGHKSQQDKQHCALRLKNTDKESRTIFIDDYAGTAHQAYGSMPNAVFIINKHGCVVFRSDWNNPSATRKALSQLCANKPVTAKSFFRPASPLVVLRTFRNAGKGSALDFFKGLPYLIWVNIIKRNIKLLWSKEVSYSAETHC